MSRIRVLFVVFALGSIFLNPLPAQAGSVWDANHSEHRLGIRWVAARAAADSLRTPEPVREVVALADHR